jgi:sigma-E factor negative regulatory protein RseC
MSTEKGVVEKVENGFAWVRAQRKSACAGCGNRSHCSIIEGGNQMLVKATNVIDAGEGDSVEIHMNSSFQLKCTFIVYIIPVLGIISGAIVSEPLSNLIGINASIGMAIFTLSGFLLSLAVSRALIHKLTNGNEINPTIKRVLKPRKRRNL